MMMTRLITVTGMMIMMTMKAFFGGKTIGLVVVAGFSTVTFRGGYHQERLVPSSSTCSCRRHHHHRFLRSRHDMGGATPWTQLLFSFRHGGDGSDHTPTESATATTHHQQQRHHQQQQQPDEENRRLLATLPNNHRRRQVVVLSSLWIMMMMMMIPQPPQAAHATYSAYSRREQDWSSRQDSGMIQYSSARDLRQQLRDMVPQNQDDKSKIFCPNGPTAAVSPLMENKCSDRLATPSVFGRSNDFLGNSIPGVTTSAPAAAAERDGGTARFSSSAMRMTNDINSIGGFPAYDSMGPTSTSKRNL